MYAMDKLLSFLRRLVTRRAAQPSPVAKLMAALAMTDEGEIACDEFHALLDQFAEAAKRGEDVRALMPLVQKHLDMCPDCREDFEGLMSMLAA